MSVTIVSRSHLQFAYGALLDFHPRWSSVRRIAWRSRLRPWSEAAARRRLALYLGIASLAPPAS